MGGKTPREWVLEIACGREYGAREEVIEMIDDDTGTTYVRDRVNHSITLETQGSGPEAGSPRDAG